MAARQLSVGTNKIDAVGRHFRLLSAEIDSSFRVHILDSVNGKTFFKGDLSVGLGVSFDSADFPTKFDRIYIEAENAQEVDIWAETARADDDRLSGNFDINAALSVAQTAPKSTRYESVTVSGNSAFEIAPENTTRKKMTVVPAGAIELSIGKITSESFEWNVQQALTVVNSDGVVVEIYEDYD